MNASVFNDDDNVTFVAGAYGKSDDNCGEPELSPTVHVLYNAVFYVALAVGIPGNILSAIVWLRHCIANKSSSAVYLATVAINDLTYLLSTLLYIREIISIKLVWLYDTVIYLSMSAATLAPLLVLVFSIERLIAILRPLQAKVICTYGTAKKTVVGVTAVSLAAQAVRFILKYFYDAPLSHTVGVYGVVLLMIVPAAILVINLIVAREVRRVANSATNLGRQQQQHHQSTVPTVMLLSTSFVYVLLSAPQCVFGIVDLWMSGVARCSDAWLVAHRNFAIAWAITQPIYAYNFFVYIVTGHRFRSELYQLCHCYRYTTSFSSAGATAVPVDDDTIVHQRASAVI